MTTQRKTKPLVKAFICTDQPVDEKDYMISYYLFEGKCKKCKQGNNTLIITDFIFNNEDATQSIFRTTCLCCSAKNIYYAKQVGTHD